VEGEARTLILLTDHAQWYDGIFDDRDPVFHRLAFTKGGLPKRAQLELFDRMGLATPPHGTVRTLAARAAEDQRVVVYEDELEHCGRGKVLLPLREALRTHPDHYATLFIPPAARPLILRHARFGTLGFWLRQESKTDDWLTRVDDDETLVARERRELNPIPRVLWAIDFLPTPFGLLAIDFNTAPDLITLDGVVSPRELLNELERASPEHLVQL
jgi:hypothetical protein